jgi:hypothetical protein
LCLRRERKTPVLAKMQNNMLRRSNKGRLCDMLRSTAPSSKV